MAHHLVNMHKIDSSDFIPGSELPNRVPYWARSTNPIVRRHLGLYWRTLPPQIQPILTGILVWILLVLLTIPFPIILELTMPVIVGAVLAIPVAVVAYAHILVTIATTASVAMSEELRNNTMTLLMATPMSLEQIFLGKIAASIWRRMDDMILVIYVVTFLAMPIIVMNIQLRLPVEEYGILSHGLMILGLIVAILRVIFEPLMVGALAILAGASVPYRSTAITTSLGLCGFYFLLINLARYMIPANDLGLYVLIEFILPVILPLIISGIALAITRSIISAD